MSAYTTNRLEFSLEEGSDRWWAIDENGVEYCIYPVSDVGWDSEMWCCVAQRRVAFNEVKDALGIYEDFEEAAAVCDAYDPVEAGLV